MNHENISVAMGVMAVPAEETAIIASRDLMFKSEMSRFYLFASVLVNITYSYPGRAINMAVQTYKSSVRYIT